MDNSSTHSRRLIMLCLGLALPLSLIFGGIQNVEVQGYYDKHIIIAIDQYRGANTNDANFNGIYKAVVNVLSNKPINTSEYMQCTTPKGPFFNPGTDEISLFTFGFSRNEVLSVIPNATSGNGGLPKDSIYDFIVKRFFKDRGRLSNGKIDFDAYIATNGPIHHAIFKPQECANNYSSVVFPNIIREIKTTTRAKEYYLFIVSSLVGGPTNVGSAIDIQNIVRDWFHSNATSSYAESWFNRVSSLEEQFTRTEVLKFITKYDTQQSEGSKTNALVLVGYKIEPKVFSGTSYASLKNSVKLEETSFESGVYDINDLNIFFPHDENLRIDSMSLFVNEDNQVVYHQALENIRPSKSDNMVFVASVPQGKLKLGHHKIGDTLFFQPVIYATPLSSKNHEEFLPLFINVPQQDFVFTSEVFKLAPSTTYAIGALIALLLAITLFCIWYYRGRLVKASVNVKIDHISKQRYMNISVNRDDGIHVTNAPCWYLRPGINEQRIHVTCSMQRRPLQFARRCRIKLSYMVKDLDENYDFTFRPEGHENDGSLRKVDTWYTIPDSPFPEMSVTFDFNAIAYVDHGKQPDFIGRENILKLGICFKAELVDNAGNVIKLLDEKNNVPYEFIAKEYFPNRELWMAFDPGTSGSCVAYGFGGVVVDKNNIHLARNYERHTDGFEGWSPIFPSKIKISDNSSLFENPHNVEDARIIQEGGDGDFWFGNAAEQLWGRNSFQSIKKLLGYSNELPIKRKSPHPNSQMIAGRDLAHLLVKGIIDRFERYLTSYSGGDNGTNDIKALEEVRPKFFETGTFQPSRAIVTVPNNFTLVKILDMVESIRRTKKFKEVHFLYEAEGVLMTYLRENWGNLKEKEEKNVIVFDMGGATINASAFTFNVSMRNHLGNNIVDDVMVRTISRIGYGIGGDDIDYALIQILCSIPSVNNCISNRNKFIREYKAQLLKYIKNFKLSYIDKKNDLVKPGNIVTDMATLWGSLRTNFKEWGIILPENYAEEDEKYLRKEESEHRTMNKYVLNNVKDAITELVNSPNIHSKNVEIIFSGRSTLYPGVKEAVLHQLDKKGFSVTRWDGFDKRNTKGAIILDDEKVKSAVAIGACWYAMWSQHITIRHDIVTSSFGFIDIKDSKEVFHPVVSQGEALENGHRKNRVAVFNPAITNISFIQMLGTNYDEILKKKIYHKMNRIIQITGIDGDVESVEIDVDDKNNFRYLVIEKSGVSHGGQDVIKDIDILDENSEAYIYAAYTSEEEADAAKDTSPIVSSSTTSPNSTTQNKQKPANKRGGGL